MRIRGRIIKRNSTNLLQQLLYCRIKRHLLDTFPLVILRTLVRPGLNQHPNAVPIATAGRVMQRRLTARIPQVQISAGHGQNKLEHVLVAPIGSPVDQAETIVVEFIDERRHFRICEGLLELWEVAFLDEIYQGFVRGRVFFVGEGGNGHPGTLLGLVFGIVFRGLVPGWFELGQMLDVTLHGLGLREVTQLVPGGPLGAASHVEDPRLRNVTLAGRCLLIERVELQQLLLLELVVATLDELGGPTELLLQQVNFLLEIGHSHSAKVSFLTKLIYQY